MNTRPRAVSAYLNRRFDNAMPMTTAFGLSPFLRLLSRHPLRWTRSFVLALLLFSSFTSYGAIIWEEDFEGPDPNVDWDASAGVWQIGEVSGNFRGTNGAGTVIGGRYPATADSRLIKLTPFLVPAAHENPRLRFAHWFEFGRGDYGVVEVQVQGNNDWTPISPSYFNTGSGAYTYAQVDLSAYAGRLITLAFHFVAVDAVPGFSDEGLGWYLDDIALCTGRLEFENPEGFENGSGDWHVDAGTWEVGSVANGAHSGTGVAATVLDGNYHAVIDTRLISPWFVVPDCGTPRLRFFHW